MIADAQKLTVSAPSESDATSLESVQFAERRPEKPREAVLAIPGNDSTSRILVEVSEAGTLDLCAQNFGADVGWHTQNRISVTAEQIFELRVALVLGQGKIRQQDTLAERENSVPILVSSESHSQRES